MGLCLFFLPNFPWATFIQGAMFIPDSRIVICVKLFVCFWRLFAVFEFCDNL